MSKTLEKLNLVASCLKTQSAFFSLLKLKNSLYRLRILIFRIWLQETPAAPTLL